MRISSLFTAFNLIVVFFFLLVLLATPLALDTIFMADTVLFAHLGWRGVNGLSPVIDFPHFYGGMTTYFVTKAFQIFGVSFKSIDYAFVMMFGAATAVLWGLSWRRLPWHAIALLLALSAALMISLFSIEHAVSWHPRKLRFNVSHSYVYNHAGIVLMMALTVFALKPTANRWLEWGAAVVAGLALYGLMLLKTTFGVMLPCVVLACMLQGRWSSVLLVLAGAGAGMLLMDPGMTRVLGSLNFLLESAAARRGGGVEGLLRSGVLILLEHLLPLFITFLLASLLLRDRSRATLGFAVAAVICAGGYGAAILTTDGDPYNKLMPILTVLTLMIADRLSAVPEPAAPRTRTRGRVPAAASFQSIAWALPAGMAYAVILPALAVSGYYALRAHQYADAMLVEDGLLAGYFVHGEADWAVRNIDTTDPAVRRAEAVRVTQGRINEPYIILDYSDRYVVYADGIALLQEIPDVSSYGIISNGLMFDFTVPMQSKVVLSYPIFPTRGLPGLADRNRLGPDVDLVMMSTEIAGWELVNDEVSPLMGPDFRACRRSTFWTLYARRTLPDSLCTLSPS
jgi:hypothetical protein